MTLEERDLLEVAVAMAVQAPADAHENGGLMNLYEDIIHCAIKFQEKFPPGFGWELWYDNDGLCWDFEAASFAANELGWNDTTL